MIDLDQTVRDALINDRDLVALIGSENRILLVGEKPKDTSFPRVGFEEISNVPVGFADNGEFLTDISYRFLIYALKGSVINAIMEKIESNLIACGFTRRSSGRLHNLPDGVRGKELIMRTKVGK